MSNLPLYESLEIGLFVEAMNSQLDQVIN